MRHKLFRALCCTSILWLLAGCCANTPCTCNDLLADSLYFSFNPTQFSKHELSTVYLGRYTYTNPTISLDSLPLSRAQRKLTTYRLNFAGQDTTGLLILSNNAPFSPRAAGANLSRYFYRLFVPQDSLPGVFYKTGRFTSYKFSNISLIGRYQTDGCCTCYQNTQKIVHVTGGSVTDSVRNVTESKQLQPLVIQLSK